MLASIPGYLSPEHSLFIGLYGLVAAVWLSSVFYSRRIAMARIQNAFSNKENIHGHPVEYWVKEFDVPEEVSFDTVSSKVISYEDLDYFFVKSTFSAITVGRMGISATLSQNPFWGLVAVGAEAINNLENKPALFKRLSLHKNEAAAYSVRRPYKFARMVKRLSDNQKANKGIHPIEYK